MIFLPFNNYIFELELSIDIFHYYDQHCYTPYMNHYLQKFDLTLVCLLIFVVYCYLDFFLSIHYGLRLNFIIIRKCFLLSKSWIINTLSLLSTSLLGKFMDYPYSIFHFYLDFNIISYWFLMWNPGIILANIRQTLYTACTWHVAPSYYKFRICTGDLSYKFHKLNKSEEFFRH